MGTWTTVLIVVVVIVVVVVVVLRSRRRREASSDMGLPPIGTVGQSSATKVASDPVDPPAPAERTDGTDDPPAPAAR